MIQKQKIIIAIIGDYYCGKSSLLRRLVYGEFSANPVAIIYCDWPRVSIFHSNWEFIFEIRDTASQERFGGLPRMYYKHVDTVLVVFDVNNRGSFENIEKWINQVRSMNSQIESILVIGNKTDKSERVVAYEEAQLKCKDMMCFYLEYSGKEQINQINLCKVVCEIFLRNFVKH